MEHVLQTSLGHFYIFLYFEYVHVYVHVYIYVMQFSHFEIADVKHVYAKTVNFSFSFL